MASRLYTVAGTPAISPTPAAGWENSSDLVRHVLSLSGAAVVDDAAGSPGTGVANNDVLTHQLIYGPIAAQTISGNFKGYIAAREVNAGTDARSQCTIRVIAPDGSTVRGTLLAHDTAALSSEFQVHASDFQSRAMPRGGSTALTSVAATAGDYVVIEIGFRNHGTNTSGVRVRLRPGSSNTTDIPENETTDVTTGHRAWFEFSNTITPYTAATGSPATTTGAANTAKVTIKPTGDVASATGTAYDATVSFLAPPRSVTISSTDYTDKIRLDSFSFVECANRGEVGIGGVDVHDAASALTIPALKASQFDEPAAGLSNKRVWTGFTHDRTTERGMNRVAGVREWGVELVDLNVLADDYILTSSDSADRGSETDYARVTWLLTTVFGSTGSISAGVVPNSNTVTMEATDYRGRKPRDVLAECSEAAGKLWFVYDYGAGRKLYYDVATGTSLSSTAKISDVASDVDSSTVWAPVGEPSVKRSPDRIYSKIHLTYNEGTVTASDAAIVTAYRPRETGVLDASITSEALAQAKVDALLAGSADEILEVTGIAIAVPAANVNDVRAGQRLQIKLERHGIGSYTYYRVIRRTVEPLRLQGGVSDVHYLVSLALASDVLASANGARGGDDIWPNKSNANDDGATVIVDRGGITVTDGAITVTNGDDIVIIDGSSDMFRIAASGSQNVSSASTGSTTLTGLGALAATPTAILVHTFNSNLSSANQHLNFAWRTGDTRYAASSSGGSPTSAFIAITSMVFGWASLNGSSQAVVSLRSVDPGSLDTTLYQKYYVLEQTAF